jgi:hypothetical protein
METKTIQVLIKNNYWRTLVEIMDFMEPFTELNSREKDVLAALLELYYKYRSLTKDEQSKLVFNASTKKSLMVFLKIPSMEVINNNLASLRRKWIIIIDDQNKNHLNASIVKNMTKFDELKFKFIEPNA